MFEKPTTTPTVPDAIIPAHNHTLVRFKFTDARPKIHYVVDGAIHLPIIAWRVRPDRIEPITIEGVHSISNDEVWSIVIPNGMLVAPGVGSWKTAHDFYMFVLERWQARKPAVAA